LEKSLQKEAGWRDNSFNLLRIIAAIAVLVSHAYPIAVGSGTTEPLEDILGLSLGTLAVLTFFAISGYFISQSFQNKPSVIDFAIARGLRVFPGLLLVLLLTVFILGPIFTKFDLKEYFSNRETILYIPHNLRLWPLQYDLPGVFDENPTPKAINGSLWSLAYEVACYVMVAVVGTLGFASNSRRFAGFLIAYATFYLAALAVLRSHIDHLTILRNVHDLSLPFVIGMTLFHFREQIPLRLTPLVVLIVSSTVSYGRPWFHELFVLTWAYGIFYLGFLKFKPLFAYNRLGDYSYGTYIYAYPVEQVIAALFKGSFPIVIITLSLPSTILLAFLSWHLVEERALAKRSTAAIWFKLTLWSKVSGGMKRRTSSNNCELK
jgi:peptidoglycan/LPS O-acetylase OafA/YrhL